MQQKSDVHIFQGMQRDIDPHKHKPEYLVDARNIRITNRGEDTNFAITSEKSTKLLNVTFEGAYVGHCVINEYVVIFTHSNEDRIYRLQKVQSDEFENVLLYKGNLNFNTANPIECLPLFENDNIIKVYWTDGINQPRMINIKESNISKWNDNSFDFSQTLKLEEDVKVYKSFAASGSFPAGTIQYVFTYYNKYGPESSIVWQSPLLYTSFKDRAGSPEETVSNAFKIVINNPDSNFEYARVYSIMRTSENAQPVVKRVADVAIPKNTNFIDLTGWHLNVNALEAIFVTDVNGNKKRVTDFGDEDIVNIDPSNKNKLNWPFPMAANFIKISREDYPGEIIVKGNGSIVYYNWSDKAQYIYISKDLIYDKKKYIYRLTCRDSEDSNCVALSTKNITKYDMPDDLSASEVRVGNNRDDWDNMVNISESTDVSLVSIDRDDWPYTVQANYYLLKANGSKYLFYKDVYGQITRLNNNVDLYVSSVEEKSLKLLELSLVYFKIVGVDSLDRLVYPTKEVIDSRMELMAAFPIGMSVEEANTNGLFKWFPLGSTEESYTSFKRYPSYKKQTNGRIILSAEKVNYTIIRKTPESSNMAICLPDIDQKTLHYYKWTNNNGMNDHEIWITDSPITLTGSDFSTANNEYIELSREPHYWMFVFSRKTVVFTDNGQEVLGWYKVDNNLMHVDNPLLTKFTPSEDDSVFDITKVTVDESIAREVINNLKSTPDNSYIQVVDNGTIGDNVDPTELLYKGSLEILSETMCQKDGTMFLGNITLKQPVIPNYIKNGINNHTLKSSYRNYKTQEEKTFYTTDFTLNIKNTDDSATSPATFKIGEIYRFGLQFQYKNGRWSDPVWVNDYTVNRAGDSSAPSKEFIAQSINYGENQLPTVTGSFDLKKVKELGYKKVRGVVVIPTLQERSIIAQGMVCPTIFNIEQAAKNSPWVQSDWFIRKFNKDDHYKSLFLEVQGAANTEPQLAAEDNSNGKRIAINGAPTNDCVFIKDYRFVTFHSADIVFNDDLRYLDLNTFKFRAVGLAGNNLVKEDWSLMTSSPSINKHGGRKSTSTTLPTNYYWDSLVDYRNGEYVQGSWSGDMLVFPWQKTGSINNDITRPEGKGTRTAVLKQQKRSYLEVFQNTKYGFINGKGENKTLSVGDNTILGDITEGDGQLRAYKLGDYVYQDNVDTLLVPSEDYPIMFTSGNGDGITQSDGLHIGSIFNNKYTINDLWPATINSDNKSGGKLGEENEALRMTRDGIRMKYKTEIHAILKLNDPLTKLGVKLFSDTGVNSDADDSNLRESNNLWAINTYGVSIIGELYRDIDKTTIFGGTSEDAFQANVWIPAGEAITIEDRDNTIVEWRYGDTYFQRFDFLKSYAFTQEDENSIITIGSFLGEFRVNADGRYDRNRGQVNNLNMSPTNFNLWNAGYNSINNFFTYKILPDDFYKLDKFSNSVTWTLEHKNSEDVDHWTQINMSSTLDLDGSKGAINSLDTWNDNIYAFQDRGISNILFNSRVQLNTTDGVPIEISNNYKVDGSRYISDTIGCSNKWSICKTPSGLYFIDPNSKNLYNIGANGLSDISTNHNMSNWFSKQDMSKWHKDNGIRTHYDFNNNDLYISTPDNTLNYSERLGQFVSFFDYNNALTLFNVTGDFYGIDSYQDSIRLHKLFADDKPCNLFENWKGYDISFISNQDSAMNKIFTNMDARADWRNLDNLADGAGHSQDFFDSIRVSNEYQDTDTQPLKNLRDRPSNLKTKFRIWRVNIPRDKTHRRDRISNPWAKITLSKYAKTDNPFILHDLSIQYYV